jgi:hypothetical protein
MRNFKLSLFNKLLGFLLLCLVCSGAVAVVHPLADDRSRLHAAACAV